MQDCKMNEKTSSPLVSYLSVFSSFVGNFTRGREQEQVDEALLATHGKTFYFAARFLPLQFRTAVMVLYRFFRMLDDLVDERGEGWNCDDVRRELNAWRDWFRHECFACPPSEEPGARLAAIIEMYHIPHRLFLDFLDGLYSDIEPQKIDTFHALYLYCYRVAGTVGRVLACVLGVTSQQALMAAEHLGVGMQLTNILRDLGADLVAGRVYLPQEDLIQFRCSEDHLCQLLAASDGPDDCLRALLRFEIARAHTYYHAGLPGIWALPPDCRLPILMAGRLYRRILVGIEQHDYDILQFRVSTCFSEKLQEMAISSLLTRFWRQGEYGLMAELEASNEVHLEG